MPKDSVIAVKPETLLVDLPSVPDWFEKDLSRVATRNGKPVFRIVDGQRELKFRNGKWDVKHLLQADGVPAYIPVIRELFRRQQADGKYKHYSNYRNAKADRSEGLSEEVEFSHVVSTRAVGRACWVVEVYIAPEEIDPASWEAYRYADLQKHGIYQKVDVLGPFPREGKYEYCFSILDEEGNAIAPNQRTIDECKRRWSLIQGDTRSVEENIKEIEERDRAFEAKEVARIADNFYQFQGISARRLHHGVVSRPITKVYE